MQPSVRIRFAKENDWDEIEQITSQNFSFQREKLQELNGFRPLVLEFEGQVIGSCLIQMEDQFEIHVTCQEELIPYFEMNDFQLEIGDKEEGVEGYHLMWHLSL